METVVWIIVFAGLSIGMKREERRPWQKEEDILDMKARVQKALEAPRSGGLWAERGRGKRGCDGRK